MGLFNVYLSMKDQYGSKSWLRSRLLPFLGMGFSAIIPIVHAALIFPYEQLQKQSGLHYYYLEGVFMLIGVMFLAVSLFAVSRAGCWASWLADMEADLPQTKFPECWLPGTFDYVGASHQIFHCFVVMGTLSHFGGIMSGYDWNYRNRRCALHA
jgi:adiponectin receptor